MTMDWHSGIEKDDGRCSSDELLVTTAKMTSLGKLGLGWCLIDPRLEVNGPQEAQLLQAGWERGEGPEDGLCPEAENCGYGDWRHEDVENPEHWAVELRRVDPGEQGHGESGRR